MKLMKAMALVILLLACGCGQEPVVVSGGPAPASAMLADEARAGLGLPAEDELTLATKVDVAYAKTLAPEVIAAVEAHLKSSASRIEISAARVVGDYLLLWVAYPDVMDGGIDLIFSVEDNRVVGTFLGGYRG